MLQVITLPNVHHSSFSITDRSFPLSHPHLPLCSFFSPLSLPFLFGYHWEVSLIHFQVSHSLCLGHPVISHSVKIDTLLLPIKPRWWSFITKLLHFFFRGFHASFPPWFSIFHLLEKCFPQIPENPHNFLPLSTVLLPHTHTKEK